MAAKPSCQNTVLPTILSNSRFLLYGKSRNLNAFKGVHFSPLGTISGGETGITQIFIH